MKFCFYQGRRRRGSQSVPESDADWPKLSDILISGYPRSADHRLRIESANLLAQCPGLTITHQKIPSHEAGRHEPAEHEFFFPLPRLRPAQAAKFFISTLIASLAASLKATHPGNYSLVLEHLAGKVADAGVRIAMELMDKNLAAVAVGALAKESGLSLRNFNRVFLTQVGLTPKEYLIRRRIDRGKVLLKETRMTVTDISMEVGYDSLSKFIGTFKSLAEFCRQIFATNKTSFLKADCNITVW